jgi:hypothetical protein
MGNGRGCGEKLPKMRRARGRRAGRAEARPYTGRQAMMIASKMLAVRRRDRGVSLFAEGYGGV